MTSSFDCRSKTTAPDSDPHGNLTCEQITPFVKTTQAEYGSMFSIAERSQLFIQPCTTILSAFAPIG
jgi:hypothetical protein